MRWGGHTVSTARMIEVCHVVDNALYCYPVIIFVNVLLELVFGDASFGWHCVEWVGGKPVMYEWQIKYSFLGRERLMGGV